MVTDVERAPTQSAPREVQRAPDRERPSRVAVPSFAPITASPLQFTGGGSAPTTWADYCNGLPGDIKSGAQSISNTNIQTGFKTLTPSEQRTIVKLNTERAQHRYIRDPAGYQGKKCRDAANVIVINSGHQTHYEQLFHARVAALEKYEYVTPDERNDLGTMTRRNAQVILESDTEWQLWNTGRVNAVLRADISLAGRLLAECGSNTTLLQTTLVDMCAGRAGERLRRILADPGFENDQTKVDFFKALRTALYAPSAGEPIAIMENLASTGGFTKKGKKHVPDVSTEISKAYPLVDLICYGTPTSALITRILTATSGHADYPKDSSGTPKATAAAARDWASGALNRVKSNLVLAFLRGGGTFNYQADISNWQDATISGGGGVAYWIYHAGLDASTLAAYKLDVIRQKLAIEEQPRYEGGVLLVDLKRAITTATTTAAPEVRRPTAIDGIWYDQFQFQDASKTYGITSGGTGEVMVTTVKLRDCDVAGVRR